MELEGLALTVMLLPGVTLTFELLTPKSNQHVYEPNYICDQNWVQFPSLDF